jgi:glycosyltransferase involved in cell wall biosynthesis
MTLGVVFRVGQPISLRLYRDNILRELTRKGVGWRFCQPGEEVGDLDVAWDPDGPLPSPIRLDRVGCPVFLTVHGVRPLEQGWRDEWRGLISTWARMRAKRRFLAQWRRLRPAVAGVIAVSNYAAGEVRDVLDPPRGRLRAIHHGVDREVFHPADGRESAEPTEPFFLHVSSCQPKKNLPRIIEAYASLGGDRPRLMVVSPGFAGSPGEVSGLEVVTEPQPPEQLAELYRSAAALVFPSLHETFGMPITEAMACGCPVLTSDVTACPEIAGDAAVLVDPTDTNAIAAGLRRLADDAELRENLGRKGLERVERFRWERSAAEHLEWFSQGAEAGG